MIESINVGILNIEDIYERSLSDDEGVSSTKTHENHSEKLVSNVSKT